MDEFLFSYFVEYLVRNRRNVMGEERFGGWFSPTTRFNGFFWCLASSSMYLS